MFMRFWFLEYYEGFQLPGESQFARVRRMAGCLHCASRGTAGRPAEQIVKLYYDYSQGAGNGALLPGRRKSSFAFEPDWHSRPWPPQIKYEQPATDAALGL